MFVTSQDSILILVQIGTYFATSATPRRQGFNFDYENSQALGLRGPLVFLGSGLKDKVPTWRFAFHLSQENCLSASLSLSQLLSFLHKRSRRRRMRRTSILDLDIYIYNIYIYILQIYPDGLQKTVARNPSSRKIMHFAVMWLSQNLAQQRHVRIARMLVFLPKDFGTPNSGWFYFVRGSSRLLACTDDLIGFRRAGLHVYLSRVAKLI